MFRLVVTYHDKGIRRQQAFNSDKIEAVMARKVLEMGKPSCVRCELFVSIGDWTKVDIIQP